jgi:hypothetical protein
MSSRSAYLYSRVEGMLNFTNVVNAQIVYEDFNLKELLEQVKSSCNWENTREIKFTNCAISVK